jgi:hypothetical protein
MRMLWFRPRRCGVRSHRESSGSWNQGISSSSRGTWWRGRATDCTSKSRHALDESEEIEWKDRGLTRW